MGGVIPPIAFRFTLTNQLRKAFLGMSYTLLRPFWFGFAALALSLSWLLPNHLPPWLAFHADAWSAVVLTGVAAFVLLRVRAAVGWHGLALLTAALIGVVTLQYSFGLIHQFGVAWINMAYLLGFLFALLVGSSWERATRRQCADMLFTAVVLAAVVSVGLQLHQWLDLEPVGPWILRSTGSRHYANMVQPNQLASLLFLGVLGCAWLYLRGWIHAHVAVALAMGLLFGLALTESRTGWINALLIVAAIFTQRRLPGVGRLPPVALGLAAFYALCVVSLPLINENFGTSGIPVQLRSVADNTRISIWKMLIEAAALRPWTGFGWGQIGHAQFLMSIDQMYPGASLQQAHNLILDLVLWNGIPIGLTVAVLLGWWGWQAVRRVADSFQLLMILFLVVLFAHAMLEYPLQYAYFLLPAGLMMGALNTSLDFRVAFQTSKWITGGVWLAGAAVLSVTIRDYFRVETSFYGLRFEQRKIQTSIPPVPPDVLVLTQWYDYIYFARLDPRQVHGAQDLLWASNLVRTMPSALGMYKLASMFAFADQPEEARQWLKILCKINPQPQCEIIRAKWLEQSTKHKQMAAVSWPE